MKYAKIIILGLLLAITNAHAVGVNYQVKNEHAKALYDNMTSIQEEGSAGHTYKRGQNIVCWRVNADMDDAQGNPIPQGDVRRYKCSVHFDSKGVATPGRNF